MVKAPESNRPDVRILIWLISTKHKTVGHPLRQRRPSWVGGSGCRPGRGGYLLVPERGALASLFAERIDCVVECGRVGESVQGLLDPDEADIDGSAAQGRGVVVSLDGHVVRPVAVEGTGYLFLLCPAVLFKEQLLALDQEVPEFLDPDLAAAVVDKRLDKGKEVAGRGLQVG